MADNLVSQIVCCICVKSLYLIGCKLHKKTILQKKTSYFFWHRKFFIKKLFTAGNFIIQFTIFMRLLLML
jgi:hypothetical protein